MNKTKKRFLIIWCLNVLCFIILFIHGRIMKIEFLNTFEFKYIKLILIIYVIYDFFKINLSSNTVDSKMIYILLLFVCIPFVIAGVTYLLKLNLYRISEFSFFVLFTTFFRWASICVETVDYLKLKEK